MAAFHTLRLALLPAGLLLAPAPAQKPILVRDLNTNPQRGYDASPEQLTVVGTTLFFTAYTAATGRELFASAGGIGRPFLVKDLVAGPQGSTPTALCAMGGKLYFGVDRQLWVSDGTAVGTVVVATLSSGIGLLQPIGRRLVIQLSCGVWFSDGTARGTSAFQKNLYIQQFIRVGPVLAFVGSFQSRREL